MKHSFNIDYLIINLRGTLHEFTKANHFVLEKNELGTKIFKNRWNVFFKNERIGTLLNDPRSEILPKDFVQFQYENHLFYTKELQDLHQLTRSFCNTFSFEFVKVNRLDIAFDFNDYGGFYKKLANDLINERVLMSGRKKHFQPYFNTEKGKPDLTGLTIGKRTASRFLRMYNKSLEMAEKPKSYIHDTWVKRGLNPLNVWRYEYQINGDYFNHLNEQVEYNYNNKIHTSQPLNWGIFYVENLFKILQLAEKNHFEIKENTGKKEVNKENNIIVHCWDSIKETYTELQTGIVKIKKVIQKSLLAQKRLLKSNLREYYTTFQEITEFPISISHILTEYKLQDYFNKKLPYYLKDFAKETLYNYAFDTDLFYEHLQLYKYEYEL